MRKMNHIEKADPFWAAVWALETGVSIDDPERKVCIDGLDEDYVVNVDVIRGRGASPEDDVDLSDILASQLGDAVVELLNIYHPPKKGWEWHCHSDAFWWAVTVDDESYEPDKAKDVEMVQHQIYMQEK